MMFGVQDTGSFQAEYQRLVEAWIKRFTEIERAVERAKENERQKREPSKANEAKKEGKASRKKEESTDKNDIKIWDSNGKLVYGETELGKVCEITPLQVQKLEDASNLSSENTLEGLPSLKIEVDGETFFQSENEKILVNERVDVAEEVRKVLGDRESLPNEPAAEKAEQAVESPLPPDVKVYLSQRGESELIHGHLGQKLISKITPVQIQKLGEASDLLPGASDGKLAGIKVKAGDEVLFQADESGKVLVNEGAKLQAAIAQIEEQSTQQVSRPLKSEREPEYDEDYPDYLDNPPDDYYEPDDYGDEDQGVPVADISRLPELDDNTVEILVEMIAPIIEALPDVEQLQELQPENDLTVLLQQEQEQEQSAPTTGEPVVAVEGVGEPSLAIQQESEQQPVDSELQQPTAQQLPQRTGLDAVQEGLGSMGDSALKSVLQGMATEMQVDVAQQQPNPEMQKLVDERSQFHQNPHWWQLLNTKVEEMVTAARETFAQHRAASTLKEFANRMNLQPDSTYEGTEYNLSRSSKEYTLTDKDGKELLKFESGVLGVKVSKDSAVLDDKQLKQIGQLRQEMEDTKNQTFLKARPFISEGAAEARELQRLSQITQAMSQYAAALGGVAKVEGKFSYDWQANAAGSAMIQDKQGNVLLAVSRGHMRSRMSEKDLSHFEQMLPALQGSAQQSQALLPSAAVSGKQRER